MRVPRSEIGEERKSTRNGVGVNCTLKAVDVQAPALLLDLSVEGGFLRCNKVIHPGATVMLQVELPGQDSDSELNIQAEVVHTGRFLQEDDNFTGFGVRFKNLSDKEKTRLQSALLLARNQPPRKYNLF